MLLKTSGLSELYLSNFLLVCGSFLFSFSWANNYRNNFISLEFKKNASDTERRRANNGKVCCVVGSSYFKGGAENSRSDGDGYDKDKKGQKKKD